MKVRTASLFIKRTTPTTASSISGYVTDPFAFVMLHGVGVLIIRYQGDGSRARCCMARFKRYKSKGVGYVPIDFPSGFFEIIAAKKDEKERVVP